MSIVALNSILTKFNVADIQFYLLLFLVLCISLSSHEAAHGWVAWKLGDDTAAIQGRLTLNPFKHLDPIGSVVFLIAGIGWARPVPINPARFDRKHTIKKGLMLTSIAGPAANLILSIGAALFYFLLLTAIRVFGISQMAPLAMILGQLFFMLYYYNIMLAVFNLLPIPPLDGFKVFGSLLPDQLYFKLMSFERYIGLVFLVLVMFARGFLGQLLQLISVPFNKVIWQPIELIFTLIWRMSGL